MIIETREEGKSENIEFLNCCEPLRRACNSNSQQFTVRVNRFYLPDVS